MPRRIALIALLTAASALPAAAQAPVPKSLGVFGAWQTFALRQNGQDVCYMALKTRGAALRAKKAERGPVVLMITQRPGENAHDIISYNAGYNFKPGSDLKIALGNAKFDLFTARDTGWSRDAMTDHTLAMAIIKSPGLTASGIPAIKGAGAVTDTVSLKGAAEAYRVTAKACGMEVEPPPKPVKSHKKSTK